MDASAYGSEGVSNCGVVAGRRTRDEWVCYHVKQAAAAHRRAAVRPPGSLPCGVLASKRPDQRGVPSGRWRASASCTVAFLFS